MLGIESPGVYWAYIGSAICALACVVYGIVNWNKGAIEEEDEKKGLEWKEREESINDAL